MHERNRRDFAIDFFRRMQARMAESGPPPLGLQIIGNYFDEARMLNVGHAFQQQTDWHLRMPEGM